MILTISSNEIRIIDIIEITIKTADMIEVVPRKDIEIVSTAEMTGLVSMIGMIGTEMVSIVEIDRERDIGTSPETPTGISPETTIEMRLTIDTETVRQSESLNMCKHFRRIELISFPWMGLSRSIIVRIKYDSTNSVVSINPLHIQNI